ncbi:MAG: hypothetical protein QG597_1843 [Actinomycetota bacterium]|nr:hypothetical protein [Actinomycetota bacterium]
MTGVAAAAWGLTPAILGPVAEVRTPHLRSAPLDAELDEVEGGATVVDEVRLPSGKVVQKRVAGLGIVPPDASIALAPWLG